MPCPLRALSPRASPATEDLAGDARPLRLLGLLFALGGFALTWAFFAAFVVFLGNLPRPSDPWLSPSADAGAAQGAWPYVANLLLVLLFGLQHSGMARPGFKRIVSRYVPYALERTIYVYAACLAGFVVILAWQPIPVVLWDVTDPAAKAALWTGFGAGWLLLLLAALSIDILELLGVKQAWAWSTGRAPAPLTLKTNWLYAWISHPMYVGVFLGLWMAPLMTVGHALLAAALTTYMIVGKALEERDLEARFGAPYRRWKLALAHAGAASHRYCTEAFGAHLRTALRPVTAAGLSGEIVAAWTELGPAPQTRKDGRWTSST